MANDETIDLKPTIATVTAWRDKLYELSDKIYEAHGFKSSGDQAEVIEIWSKLNELINELVILDETIPIQQEGANDQSLPDHIRQQVRERLERDKARATKLIKQANRLIPKAAAVYDQMSKEYEKPRSVDPPPAPAQQPAQKEVPRPKVKERSAPAAAAPKVRPDAGPGNRIITDVYNGSVTRYNLPVNYYEGVRDELMGAVEKGIGNQAAFESLVGNLNTNAQAFAGAKTYNLVRELEDLKGKAADQAEFELKAKAMVSKYDLWGEAEVNTAQQQTHQAKQWQIIDEDKDLFPILKYQTIGDACKICRPLDGLTAPVNSPIWKRVYPCNHYNCYCIVIQLTTGELTPNADKLVNDSVGLMNDTFISNPGVTQQLFTGKHPYFASIPASDRDFAKQNFGLPIK